MATQEPLTASNWPAPAADLIERLVGTVRDKTTGPVIKIVRGIVFGFVIAVLATASLVLITITAVRALTNFLPGGVWFSYIIAAAVFLAAGTLCWSRRTRRSV
jgi:hypothetical protein